MTVDLTSISSYDYELPSELIASHPTTKRDEARLLVVDRAAGTFRHCLVRDLPQLLAGGDRLVLNNTRVIPARLTGHREQTGGKWEGLFLRAFTSGEWELLSQTRGRLHGGETILISREESRGIIAPLRLRLTERGDEGAWRGIPESSDTTFDLLEKYGNVPLPPYIRKGIAGEGDIRHYQTIFSQEKGSVAAPTAGLHFTHELLDSCRGRSINTSFVTLHIGIGTFRPIATDRLDQHQMHAEWAELTSEASRDIRDSKASGGRIAAVGTTSMRVLETAASSGELKPFRDETRLFIRPPFRFNAVDVLLTNFHLPRSTLLVLVSTFGGYDLIREAYAEAIRERYRFYSYGDAMLIL